MAGSAAKKITVKKRAKPAGKKGGAPASQPDVAVKSAGFPVVGIGASAGGLEAFETFFSNVQPGSGMAYVLVSHLDPGHASLLSEILQRNTRMPVSEAVNRMAVEPDHVYVIPPNREMSIFHGALQLSLPEGQRGQRMPVDLFLRSLAAEQGEKAIGVILSGTGSDGTLGLRAIQGAGGVTFVQDPATAKYDGMPHSAVSQGLATYVLPVEKIPGQLADYVRSFFGRKLRPSQPLPGASGAFHKIIMSIRSMTGNDFSLYKQTTVSRRVERRRSALGIADLERYASYLQKNPGEALILNKELLINVTSFFRDAEAFNALKKAVLPQLLRGRPDNHVFRLWVPGCATGEEAYSLAIIFKEFMASSGREHRVQIYSTDIDDDSIATARGGLYPGNISIDVSEARLQRFFTREETGYRIKKEIREMIIFASQNITRDAPFTKLDMVSCRNVLIYLEPDVQERLMHTFHFALRPGGILLLGPSESIGINNDLFATVNRKWKIFRSKPAKSPAPAPALTLAPWKGAPLKTTAGTGAAATPNYADVTRKALLDIYAPCAVITDYGGTILYVHGDTSRYLRPAPGHASLDVVEMAREGLKLALRRAIERATSPKMQETVIEVKLQSGEQAMVVSLAVRPLPVEAGSAGLLLISFQDSQPDRKGRPPRARAAAGQGVTLREGELERELAYTRENLQATIEEMQAANEELKSTNEELQSTNEELQSTNEELETSREELQSLNEELVTVNSEYQAKIDQMMDLQNDLKNLLDTISVGTIFLDTGLCIKRFARDAARIFRLLPSDIGRPLGDIKSSIVGEDMVASAQQVLDTLVPQEKEVSTSEGSWYLVRVTPYRTLDNVIDGVVLTFNEISALKRSEMAATEARNYAEAILDMVREPLVVLDGDLNIISATDAFNRMFGLVPGDTPGQRLYDLDRRQWDIPALKERLADVLPAGSSFEDFPVEYEFPGKGSRRLLLSARAILEKTGGARRILLAIDDTDGTGEGA